MGFKNDHPNYQSYENGTYSVRELPSGFRSALQGFIVGKCPEQSQLKAVLHALAARIPTEPTTNWGKDYLVNDLSDYSRALFRKPMPKTMDFLADLCGLEGVDISVEELNELLEDEGVGYSLERSPWGTTSTWNLLEDVESRALPVEDAVEAVKDVCAQTYEHLLQARELLLNTKTDRDRKDAIRDCLSAMESMLKTLSKTADIKAATQALRTANTWGPDIIVKDGLSLWDRMHQLYPDVRHGQSTGSVITDDEALYWIERITTFVRYMARMYQSQP